jgi:4-amino-4-deoxy-L-arabinose transferase-like glycosyltransferase
VTAGAPVTPAAGDPVAGASERAALHGVAQVEERSHARGRTRDRRAAALLTALGSWLTLVMLWRWPVFTRESFESTNSLVDLSFYAYAGELLRTGATPYVDFWDHKPPLIYLLHAAGLAVSGGRVWGVWLVSWASVLLALVLAYRTLERAFGRAAASLGTVFFAFSVTSIFSLGLTEWYILPISWATALALVSRDVRERSALPLGVALGVLATLGALLKPNMIGAPVAAALVAAGLLGAHRRWRSLGGLVVGGVAGVLGTLAPVLAWLAAIGALDAFVEQVLAYNAAYVGTAPSWRLRVRAVDAGLWAATLYTSLVLPALGWLVAAARIRTRRTRDPALPVLLLAVVWPPIEMVLAATSGRDYSHYFTTFYPPFTLLVGLVGAELARRVPASETPRPRAAFALVPMLALTLAAHGAWRMFWRERDDQRSELRATQLGLVADHVRRIVPAGRPIFVWGHAVDVYMLSGRRPASEYVYVQPLLTPGFADSARVRAFVAGLAEAAPAVIVDGGARDAAMAKVDGADLTPPLGGIDTAWSYPKVAMPGWKGPAWWHMPETMRAFYDFVARDYVPTDTIGPQRWIVYRRRADLAATATREAR